MKNKYQNEKVINTTGEHAQKNWKKLTKKFKSAIPPNKHEYVSVNLTNAQYLNEIVKDGTVKKFDPQALKQYELFFDKHRNCLIDYKEQLANTQGCSAKGEGDNQIFILTKEGKLFLGSYTYGSILLIMHLILIVGHWRWLALFQLKMVKLLLCQIIVGIIHRLL